MAVRGVAWWLDRRDSDLRTVTDLIALVSMLLSEFAVVRCIPVGAGTFPAALSLMHGEPPPWCARVRASPA
jgi:hypothetical protein